MITPELLKALASLKIPMLLLPSDFDGDESELLKELLHRDSKETVQIVPSP